MAFNINSFWFQLITAILVLICTAVFYIKRRYNFWKSQGIAQITPTFPMGNSQKVFRTISSGEFLEKLHLYYRSKGEVMGGYYVGLRPELLVVHPEMIKNILVKDFSYFTERCLHIDPENDPLTNNLIGMGGEIWQKMRKKLTPIFTLSKVKSIMPILIDTSVNLDKVLDESARSKKPVDISQIMFNYTADEIGSWIYGLQVNSLQNKSSEFRKHVDFFFVTKGFKKFLYLFSYLYSELLKKLKIKLLPEDLTNFFMNVVKDTVSYRENNNVTRNDFLQYLLQLKIEGNENSENGLTLEEIAAQCYLFFSAGYETSAESQNFCLYELAKHQDIQDKLRAEILQVIEKHNGELTYDIIMEMTYLDKVAQETLRKYPSLPFVLRRCTQNYMIPNTKILLRKGQVVNISLLGLHKDPAVFPDPEKFDPERFTEEEKNKRGPYTYIPFGAGPRVCIGAKLGLLKMKMGIITVIRNYKITLTSNMKERLELAPDHITMCAKNGVWINIAKISNTP